MRWRLPFFAFSAGILSLWFAGPLGGALAFGLAAALAWRTGRSSALRWTLTTLAVVCTAGLMIMVLDARTGVGTLIEAPG